MQATGASQADLPVLLSSRPRGLPDLKPHRRSAPPALELCEAWPAEVCVKNTFIDVQSPPPTASHGRRALQTCPSKHVGRLSLDMLLVDTTEEVSLPSPCRIETPFGERCFAGPLLHAAPSVYPPRFAAPPIGVSTAARCPPPPPSGPAPGSSELPSSGSAAHGGGCRPCAFVHAGRCREGFAFDFCHLCGPRELRRRRREKRDLRRTRREPGQTSP